jgi:hypothetical protein
MLIQNAKLTSEAQMQATPLFARLARWVERQVGRSTTFVVAIAMVSPVGRFWPVLWVVRHMAAGHQHRHHNRHFPDGVRNPEYSKPRHASDAAETGLADPGQ